MENDMQIVEVYTLDVIATYDRMDREEEFTDESHTLKFDLPCKYFKKLIANFKTMSKEISIHQDSPNSSLMFGIVSENRKIKGEHTIKDAKLYNIESKVTDDNSFRVDLKINDIKPISSSHIADTITLLVDENKPFMTRAIIDDGTIEIKTLTYILDNRLVE